jgi:hypothetical protein
MAVVAAVGALFAGSALAAEGARVGGVNGSVMVNQNGRYVPAASVSVLRAGDRVMTTTGSATITYADGCNVAVAARSMATVAAVSPCAGGSSSLVKVSTRADSDDRGGYGYGDDYDFWLWASFGVVTVGVTANALGEDESPSSP